MYTEFMYYAFKLGLTMRGRTCFSTLN